MTTLDGYTLAANVENLILEGGTGTDSLTAKSNAIGATITTNAAIDTITGEMVMTLTY